MPRVLLLDDDVAVANAHARLLRHAGLNDVEVCTSAVVALERVAAGERFDVVLADGRMPHLDGVDFYRCALDSWPELRRRIVFLTAGLPEEERRFVEEQGLPFFTKPLCESDGGCGELVSVLDRLGRAPH